jgi:hypothetical protein
MQENRYAYLKTRNTINLVTLVMGGEFGSKVYSNPLGNRLDPIWCIPWYTSQFCQVSKFPEVLQTSYFPLGIQTFLVLFHGWNNFLWHPDAFGSISFVGLLVGLNCYHLSILFILDQIWCSSLFVHLVDVGVGNFACWLLLELCLSPVFALHWKGLWPSLWHSLQITVSPSTGLLKGKCALGPFP